jgi:hypothetical protein
MGKNFSVKSVPDCLLCGKPVPFGSRSYCSKECRQLFHSRKNQWRSADWTKKNADLRASAKASNKIQCLECGKWYRQVGSHVALRHNMTAREYREKYGFDVKRGQLPEDLRELKAGQVFENGTVNNLKKGKKFWFKKGQEGVGVYNRSDQTMQRLHLGTKALKSYKDNLKKYV